MTGIFEHAITVYNRRIDAPQRPGLPPGGARRPRWHRTVINGAQWRDAGHASVGGDGATVFGKAVSVTIPEEADCWDKTFVAPSAFGGIPEDRLSEYWTVSADPANPDIIVLGEGPEIDGAYTIADLERDHRHMRPREVTDGSHVADMPMIRIRGV